MHSEPEDSHNHDDDTKDANTAKNRFGQALAGKKSNEAANNNSASPAAETDAAANEQAAAAAASAAAAAAVAANAPQLTAFQRQIADLEKQRSDMAAANDTYRAQAEVRATTQAAEMQALMTNLTSLQTLVASNQRDANERMATADANFLKFQKEMTQARRKPQLTASQIKSLQQRQRRQARLSLMPFWLQSQN